MTVEILRPDADGDISGLYNNVYWDHVDNWSYVDEAVADDWDTYQLLILA